MEYSFSPAIPNELEKYAWYRHSEDVSEEELFAHEVGLKEPNPWGLYDMHGNLFEWCLDRFEKRYYFRSPITNPVNTLGRDYVGNIKVTARIQRGGSFNDNFHFCRSAARSRNLESPANTVQVHSATGLRVVLEIE